MPRTRRIIVPGEPHHVTQRGNRRCEFYRDSEDHEVYLFLLNKQVQIYSLELFSYCCMTNHVHLVATPADGKSLSSAMRDLHSAFAIYFNRKYNFTGHLVQNRFYSCVLDPAHFWAAIRYVEQNPVRAALVAQAEDYRWSSAQAHCGLEENPLLAPLPSTPGLITYWSEWLAGEEDESRLRSLRLQTRTGRPCGSDQFLDELEVRLNRPVRPQKSGRRRKGSR
ncbi:MAG: transposase [Acidobacteria bacterium]|nr:transposase [Acidobacteriota bacterium]